MKQLFFAISITLFLVAMAFSQEPSPPLTQGQPRKMNTKTNAKSYIQTENNEKQTINTVSIATKKGSADGSNTKTQNRYNAKGNKQTRSLKDDHDTYSMLLTIFTFCLVICNVLLWWSTKKSADAAKEAADAAKKSVNTIPTIERAYIYVSSVSADFESWRGTKPNQRSPISITVRNYGRTPAKLIGIATKFQIGTSDGKTIDWKPHEDNEIIDAVGRFIASNSENDFFYYVNDTFGDGRYHLIFSGEVRYKDIFEKDHTAYFRWFLVSHFERGFYINDPDENYTT